MASIAAPAAMAQVTAGTTATVTITNGGGVFVPYFCEALNLGTT